MKKTMSALISGLIIFLSSVGGAMAHCEIPCGIYDDSLRVKLIYEHIGTIKKSMNKIKILEKKTLGNHNQLVRWISNKEKHAEKIQHIVSRYFMTQRIKFSSSKYAEKLGVLHKMLVYAMKCKQTVNPENADVLKTLTRKFEELYF